mmetsp:Transcript_45733/g.118320  ORF Transcript_45733/g.118320 Transcript_45733/m.118320 type:complete len:533 (-) Transcript_45733:220-1818(-)
MVLHGEGADALLLVEVQRRLAEGLANAIPSGQEAADFAALALLVARQPGELVVLRVLKMLVFTRDDEVAEHGAPAVAEARGGEHVVAHVVDADVLLGVDADAPRERLGARLEEHQPQRRLGEVVLDPQGAEDVLLVFLQGCQPASGIRDDEDQLCHVAAAALATVARAQRRTQQVGDGALRRALQVVLRDVLELGERSGLRGHHHGVRPGGPVGGVVELQEHGREYVLVRVAHGAADDQDVVHGPLHEHPPPLLLLGENRVEAVEVGCERRDTCNHAAHRQGAGQEGGGRVVSVADRGDGLNGPVHHREPREVAVLRLDLGLPIKRAEHLQCQHRAREADHEHQQPGHDEDDPACHIADDASVQVTFGEVDVVQLVVSEHRHDRAQVVELQALQDSLRTQHVRHGDGVNPRLEAEAHHGGEVLPQAAHQEVQHCEDTEVPLQQGRLALVAHLVRVGHEDGGGNQRDDNLPHAHEHHDVHVLRQLEVIGPEVVAQQGFDLPVKGQHAVEPAKDLEDHEEDEHRDRHLLYGGHD